MQLQLVLVTSKIDEKNYTYLVLGWRGDRLSLLRLFRNAEIPSLLHFVPLHQLCHNVLADRITHRTYLLGE